MRFFLLALIVVLAPIGCSQLQPAPVTIVSVSDVQWEQLNPARGDKSPQAATLWGDRKGSSPTGFLVKFVDGFSSPPHIHNVSYRGVVISGLIHNDDPDAASMWMPKGSFWTQPKGEVHITAAKGNTNVAYIEIEEGPYLVRPAKEAFDSGERPVNIVPSNLVWLESTGAPGVKVAFVWGVPEKGRLNGTLLKLPGGFTGTIQGKDSSLLVVSIQGQFKHGTGSATANESLAPGSYFSSTGKTVHSISCEATSCVFYVRALGNYDVVAE